MIIFSLFIYSDINTMLDQQAQSQVYCDFTITNNTTIIIETLLACASVALVTRTLITFWKIKDTLSKHTLFIYSMVALWWLAFVTLYLGNLIVHELSTHNPQRYDEGYLSTASRFLMVIAWIDAFVIQATLLYVPYHWSEQILNLFEQLGRMSDLDVSETPKVYKGWEKIIYTALKVYTKIRLCFIVFPILFLVITSTQAFFAISLSCHLVDSLVISMALGIGMYSIKKTTQLKEILDELDNSRIFNQYLWLVIASIFRITFDAIMAFWKYGNPRYKDHCPSLTPEPILETIIDTISTVTTHLLPIFIILRIYTVEENPEALHRSLIVTSGPEREDEPINVTPAQQ